MKHTLIVRSDGPDRYSARSAVMPAISAEAPSEAEAVEQVRQKLLGLFTSGKAVEIDLPGPDSGGDASWLRFFGHSAGDPNFEEYRSAIRQAREEADAP